MDRRFLIIWAGQLVSTLGTVISAFGAAIWVFVETDSLVWLSILTMMATLPAVLTAPLTGLIDRFDRRLVMIVADTTAAIVTGILVAVWVVTDLQPWHLVVGTFVAGLASSFQQPAYEAVVPSIVDPEDLGRANGLVQIGPSTAIVIAPALAGLLLAWGGIGAIFAIDLATFVVAVLALLAVKFSAIAAIADEDSSGDDEALDTYRLRDAARWVLDSARPIAYLIGVMAILNFFLAIFNISVLARGTRLGGEAGAGIAPTVGGVVMVIVSLVIGAKGIPSHRMRTVKWSIAVFGCATLIAASSPSLVALSIGVGLGMATAPLMQTTVSTTFQERVKPSMHGRVFGLRNAIGRGTYPIGALAAALIGAWSLPATFVVVAVAMLLTAAAMAMSTGLKPLEFAPGKAPSGS